jgi:hypothetical protein
MIVIYLYVCSIYDDDDDDDDDDDEATRESPETRGRGLCSYLGFFRPFKTRDPNERKQQKNDSKRESAERERDRRRRRRRIKRE